MHKKLFIPGPTEVTEEILEAMATPMIGHRSSAYATLQGECESKVKQMLYTENRVFLFTSSSTGVMEGAIRNCVGKKVLGTINGEFSRRWYEIALSCGVPGREDRGRAGPGDYPRARGRRRWRQGRVRRRVPDPQRDLDRHHEPHQGDRGHGPRQVPGRADPGGCGQLDGRRRNPGRRMGPGRLPGRRAEVLRPAARA